MKQKWLMLLSCAALIVLSQSGRAQSTGEHHALSCEASFQAVAEDALNTIKGLKLGDSRAQVERDFQMDGGMTFAPQTRYRFKKCPFVKVDVDFSGPNTDKGDISPTDKITGISRLYLEYPFSD